MPKSDETVGVETTWILRNKGVVRLSILVSIVLLGIAVAAFLMLRKEDDPFVIPVYLTPYVTASPSTIVELTPTSSAPITTTSPVSSPDSSSPTSPPTKPPPTPECSQDILCNQGGVCDTGICVSANQTDGTVCTGTLDCRTDSACAWDAVVVQNTKICCSDTVFVDEYICK
jgi:hypothetical protein